jgi:pyruvate,orthophosphate dikinase
VWEQAIAKLRMVEQDMGRALGDPSDPLLLSVRSGAAISMPGMMDTVLNLGLNDVTAAALEKQFGTYQPLLFLAIPT